MMKVKNKQKIISGLKAEIAKCVFFSLMLALPSLFTIVLGAVSADEPQELAVIIALSVFFALGTVVFVFAAFNKGAIVRNLQSAHAPEANFKTVRCTQIRPIKKYRLVQARAYRNIRLAWFCFAKAVGNIDIFSKIPSKCLNSIFFQAS